MTKQEIAEFINSIDWDDLLLKPEPPAVGPKVTALAGKELSLEAERERQARHARELIEREKRELERAREHNRPWIEEMRRIGEYHASQKRMHMETEYWAREQSRDRWNYDPIRRFQNEIEQEIRDKE